MTHILLMNLLTGWVVERFPNANTLCLAAMPNKVFVPISLLRYEKKISGSVS